MGAGISGGGPRGAHEAGARPVPLWPNGGPPGEFSVPEILKYSAKTSYFILRTFGEYLRIYGTENTLGGCTSGPQALGARPPLGRALVACGSHVGPPHLFQHPLTSSSSRKNPTIAQTRVLAHLATIFDLLAQISIHKTGLGDCSSVCDSSNGPISFCSSALYIEKF